MMFKKTYYKYMKIVVFGFLLIFIVVSVFLYLKKSQILLGEKINKGILSKQKSTPVTLLKPLKFKEKTKSFDLGGLSFELPLNRIFSINSCKPKKLGIVFEIENMKCIIYYPVYHNDDTHLVKNYLKFLPSDTLNDEISLKALLYASGPKEFSFWMDNTETKRLETILSLKEIICISSAEKVEKFYNRMKNIKGILVTMNARTHTYEFTYYSCDQKTEGIILFYSNDNNNPRDFIEAFISSLSLQSGNSSPKERPELVVEKTVAVIQESIRQSKDLGK